MPENFKKPPLPLTRVKEKVDVSTVVLILISAFSVGALLGLSVLTVSWNYLQGGEFFRIATEEGNENELILLDNEGCPRPEDDSNRTEKCVDPNNSDTNNNFICCLPDASGRTPGERCNTNVAGTREIGCSLVCSSDYPQRCPSDMGFITECCKTNEECLISGGQFGCYSCPANAPAFCSDRSPDGIGRRVCCPSDPRPMQPPCRDNSAGGSPCSTGVDPITPIAM